MEKRKFKLRYLYEGGATMEEFYDVPVAGIMLENGSRISAYYGSNADNRAVDAEEAGWMASESGLMLIDAKDFVLIRSRQKEIRDMLEKSKAMLVLAHDYVWTQDAKSGEMVAYSLLDGSKREKGGLAVAVLKYK